jgi:hypothetical protein
MNDLLTREQYYQYFHEVKQRGFVLDDYNDETPIQDLEQIYRHINIKLAEKAAAINAIIRNKDLRRKT